MTINKLVSKWCNPSIKYQKILIFQGKSLSFNKTLTFYEHFLNNQKLVYACKEQIQEQKTGGKQNE